MSDKPWLDVARAKDLADQAEANVYHAEEILMRAKDKLAILEKKVEELTLVAMADDAAWL